MLLLTHGVLDWILSRIFTNLFILEIKTVECLCKSYDVRTIAFPEAQFSEHVRKTNDAMIERFNNDRPILSCTFMMA